MNLITSTIRINDPRDIEFINIIDRNREDLVGRRTISAGCSNSNRASAPVGFAINRASNGDDSSDAADGESSAIVISQAVGDGIRRRVAVGTEARQVDDRTRRGVLIDIVCSRIRVDRSRHIKFILIDNADREVRICR